MGQSLRFLYLFVKEVPDRIAVIVGGFTVGLIELIKIVGGSIVVTGQEIAQKYLIDRQISQTGIVLNRGIAGPGRLIVLLEKFDLGQFVFERDIGGVNFRGFLIIGFGAVPKFLLHVNGTTLFVSLRILVVELQGGVHIAQGGVQVSAIYIFG